MDWTAIGTVLSVLAGVWAIVTYKTSELEKRMNSQDDKIFLLATGKSLKEAVIEAKQNGK